MIGVPKYDQGQCIGYVVEKLRENGFNLRYFHPNTILISWGHWIPSCIRDEIKKKMNKNIDGYGNIVEEKSQKTGNSDIDNMFKLNESREKQKIQNSARQIVIDLVENSYITWIFSILKNRIFREFSVIF